MKLFRHGSIRRKLTRIVMASSCAALLLACTGFVINDIFKPPACTATAFTSNRTLPPCLMKLIMPPR